MLAHVIEGWTWSTVGRNVILTWLVFDHNIFTRLSVLLYYLKRPKIIFYN
jgi:hypothetical protein